MHNLALSSSRSSDTPHETPDRQDVRAIRDYWSNLSRWQIDDIWQRGADLLVTVSPRHLAPTDPPDQTIYRFVRAERSVDGQDVETISFEEIAWVNGAQDNEWSKDDE